MGKQNKTKRYIWGGQQSRDKQKQLRLALALACCGCALLWATPIQAAHKYDTGLTLIDGQTYVVKQGETISVSADNRGGDPTEADNSAAAYGVKLDSGSATIQGSQIPITSQAWGGTATGANAYANANAYGLYADNSSTITINGDAVITSQAWGGTATGANAYANANAYGLYADNSSTITVNGDTVITAKVTGGTATGKDAFMNAHASASAYGLFAHDGTITVNGDAVITAQARGGTATGANANADANAYAYGLEVTDGNINVNGGVVITLTATGGTANTNVNVEATASAYGLEVAGGRITVSGDAVITVQASGGQATGVDAKATAHGLEASYKGSTITVNGDAVISVQAWGGTATSANTNGFALASASAYGLYADNSNKINIGGDAVITAQAVGGTANGQQDQAWARSLYAERSGSITLNAAGTRTVQLIGDVEAKNGGQVSVPLTNVDSFLQGNVVTQRDKDSDFKSVGTVALTVANGAVWQPVYNNRNGSFFDRSDYEGGNVDSNGYQTTINDINAITLQNGGVVDLGWDTPLRGGSWRIMKINELTTNDGIIRINSDIIDGTGDVFEITKVNADASLGVQVGYDPVIEKVYGTYTGEHTVLTGTAAQNIATYGVTGENRARAYTPTMDGVKIVAVKIEPSSNIKAAGSAAYGGLQLGAAVGNHLNKRLGELRDGSEAGVWARVYGGDLKNSAHGYMKTRYKGIQGGYDQAYDENGGTGRIGGAFSYASGDLELPRGGGDNKGYDLALYKTWQGVKGHYYDLVLHYGKVDTDYHTTDLNRHYSTASFDAHTLGLTAEYGYRKDLQAGWYCQPQAEVSWFRLGSADYTASSGMQVAQDSATSLQGRLGIGVGRKLANGTHYYATLSGVHEFDGKVSLRGDGLGYEQDYGGTWGEFVLGVTAPIDKRWDGYASAERLFGGDMGSTWQLNAGVRLRF